jgi:parvulin-like peptidyl-prolyl isomerase
MVAGNLVGQELLILEARKQKISVSSVETDSVLEKFKSNFPSLQDYRKALTKAGDTEESLKKKLRREIQIEKLLKTRLKVLSRPSEKEMKTFFQKNRNKFPKNDSLRASQIVIKIAKNESVIKAEEARKKLELIRNELENIHLLDERLRKFAAAALRFSETPESKVGGDLNSFQYGDFFKEFDEEIKTLKVGQVSQVFKTPLGYHLVLLTEKNDGSYDNYRLKILQHLLAKQTVNNQEELEKMLKELIKKFKVTYLDKSYKGSLSVNLKRKGS